MVVRNSAYKPVPVPGRRSLPMPELADQLEGYYRSYGIEHVTVEAFGTMQKERRRIARAIGMARRGTMGRRAARKWAHRLSYRRWTNEGVDPETGVLLLPRTNKQSLPAQGKDDEDWAGMRLRLIAVMKLMYLVGSRPHVAGCLAKEASRIAGEVIWEESRRFEAWREKEEARLVRACHHIRKEVECPRVTRHLNKAAYNVAREILQYAHRGGFAATAEGTPVASRVQNLRKKGWIVVWVIGVGRTGEPHTHYWLIPPEGVKGDEAVKKLCLDYLGEIVVPELYAVYMAQNYMEDSMGRLPRGQRRFGIGADARRMTREDKLLSHPRRTRAEMEQWQKAVKVVQQRHGISRWGRKNWIWLKREEIREVAEGIELKYDYPLMAVSGERNVMYSVVPNPRVQSVYDSHDDWEVQLNRPVAACELDPGQESDTMLWFLDFRQVRKIFEYPHFFTREILVDYNTSF